MISHLFPINSPADDDFKNKSIRGFRQAPTRPKIDFPSRVDIKVSCDEDGMVLLADSRYFIDLAHTPVIFEAQRNFMDRVGCFHIGFKRGRVIAMAIEPDPQSWIHGNIKLVQLFVNNGSDLKAPG